ncbi:MAG: DUF3617 family protein [Betaproteobacteria bacterium]|nr:MAG: DUF3617 family protein [Betaproteobacteria bacterium]
MAGSLALVCSAAAWATLPGVWEVTTSMQGAPSGERKSSATACVNVTQMKSGFEQAMLDISASGTLKGGLKCVVTDLVRSSAGSKWKASCEGPVGAMQGSGAATTEGASASLIQSFELQTPFGARPLKQVLQAKRLGDCK